MPPSAGCGCRLHVGHRRSSRSLSAGYTAPCWHRGRAGIPATLRVGRGAGAHPQARARPWRARAARRLAAAPAAAVAGRAALQRLGARGRRRDRARRHRDARAGLVRASRAGARDGQPADRERAPAALHARPLRPLRPGGDDHRAHGLRAVDASQPRAHDARRARTPSRRSTRRLEVARQSGVPDAPLRAYEASRRGRASASRRSSSPTSRSSRASRSRPTSAPGRSSRRRVTRPRTSASTRRSAGS